MRSTKTTKEKLIERINTLKELLELTTFNPC